MGLSPDFDFGNNQGVDLNFRLLPTQIVTDAVRPIATAFVANVNRLHALWALPIEAAFWGGSFTSIAEFIHLIKHGENADAQETDYFNFSDLESGLMTQLIGKIKEAMDSEYTPDKWKKLWERGSLILQGIASAPSAHTSEGIQATLSSIVLGAWSAFEIATNDLWIAAINSGPHEWSGKVFNAKGRLTPDDPKASEQEKSINLSKLGEAEYAYDLRKKMGTLLKDTKKVDFQSLKNTRKAYEVVFEDETERLFEHPDHKAVVALEAVRNLLVHRGGIADDRFTSKVKRFSLFKLEKGERLLVDGPMAVSLLNCATRLGCELLRFVDQKLIPFEFVCPVI